MITAYLSLIALVLFLPNLFFHLGYFATLPGLLILFYLPGWALLSLLYPRTFNRTEEGLFSILLSIYLNSLIAFCFYVAFRLSPVSQPTLAVILGTTFIFTVAAIIRQRFLAPSEGKRRVRFLLREHWPLLAGLLIYGLVQAVNFLIYPYIPEADGYSLLLLIRQIVHTGLDLQISSRPLFPLFGALFVRFSGLSASLLFKYLFPLLSGIIIIPAYNLARRLRLERWGQLAAVLLPITFPVVMQEIDIVRTQSVVLVSGFAIVWLLIRFVTERNWNLFFLALILSITGVAFHEISLLFLLGTLITFLPELIRKTRHSPGKVIAALLYILFAALPYAPIISSRYLPTSLISSLFSHLLHGPFRLWFINHYVNADGNEVGWPGLQAFLYYGYNLGLAAPALILYFLFRRRRESPTPTVLLFPAWVFAGLFFLFAEVTPRFGVAYLPDRAWLYLSTFLPFLLIPGLRFLDRPFLRRILFLLIAGSLLAGISVTYLKQGWITREEYAAALWLKANTPANSQILTQTGNGPLIEVYASRSSLTNPSFFFLAPTDEEGVLRTASISRESYNHSQTDSLKKALQTDLPNLFTVSDPREVSLRSQQFNQELQQYVAAQAAEAAAAQESTHSGPLPTYVLYSYDKFHTIYSQRDWWRQDNAYGADLNRLKQDPNLKLIYNRSGVLIWSYLPSLP